VDDAALLQALIELARRLGIEVRELEGAPIDDLPLPGGLASGVCRLRGRLGVVLGALDPAAHRIELLANALREHSGPALDAAYLLPAVRARLRTLD
jgi:hypothetical protein